MLRILLVTTTMLGAGAVMIGTGAAYADDVIIHRDGADVPPPASSSTTVEKHTDSDGCASKTVHKDNDMGDSKTVHSTNCD